MKKILEKFVKENKLKKEKGINFDQIQKRLERAQTDINNAKMLLRIDQIGAFRMAYDSMLQAGISLLLSFGYRPVVNGFHKTIVNFTKEVLGEDYAILTKKFDQMRKNRHEAIYDIIIISDKEAEDSIKTAKELFNRIIKYIKKNNPQKELF
jgi:uncharacterized protein (UPF0332 family)